MVDWVALAGIGSTAAVGLGAQLGTALTKRGDRKHASQLDFDKRVWEAKSAALVSVIAKCERLRDAVDVDPPGGRSPVDQSRDARRRQLVLTTFDRIGLGLQSGDGADLLAYASKPVTEKVAKLTKLLSYEYVQQLDYIDTLGDVRVEIESAIDNQNFELAAALRQREREIQTSLGNVSNLDVDAVKKLCDEIIAAARKDLRGN